MAVGEQRAVEIVTAAEVEVATADAEGAESEAESLEDLLDYISEGKADLMTLCCVCDAAGGGAFSSVYFSSAVLWWRGAVQCSESIPIVRCVVCGVWCGAVGVWCGVVWSCGCGG